MLSRITNAIKRPIPAWLKSVIKRMIPYYNKVVCPICGQWAHEFEEFGVRPRPNARCPGCDSLERHRMVWHFFQRKTDLFDGRPKRMLHVAPEPGLPSLLSRVPNLDYLTADLENPSAMVAMDITEIGYPENSFDIIYCSHVLEHVHDDWKALREFRRVLKPKGWAVLGVPIEGNTTFEDPSVTDPKERERLFGQFDHVRVYGSDFADRLLHSGFAVQIVRPADVYSQNEMTLYAVPTSEYPIFFCTPAICE